MLEFGSSKIKLITHMFDGKYDVAIIGGGVIGAISALFLRQHGLNIVVLERNSILANEASRAGGGIISPLHPWRYSEAMLDLASWSHEFYPDFVKQISAYSGVNVPLTKTGMIVPDTIEAEDALNCKFLNSRIVLPDEIFEIEPSLASRQESVFVEGVCNVRNPALCKALPVTLKKASVHMMTNVNINQVHFLDSMYEIDTNYRKLFAEKIVVCAGAWSSEVFDLFGNSIDQQNMPSIYPVKGQMLAFKAKSGLLRTVILEQNRYLIPRHDGIVIVGSTVENVGFEKQTTNAAKLELLDFAHKMLPSLRRYPVISHWSGLRPGCDRDKPYICQVKNHVNLFLNIGHFRNGLLSAPASAQVLADIMLGLDTTFDLNQYAI